MAQCKTCSSNRIADVCAKCSDLCGYSCDAQGIDYDGYVPDDVGIGGGDYIELEYCLDCGQIQGEFPIHSDAIERAFGG